MADSLSTDALAAEEEERDSEWEYEYHETETESFYVTLDISSAADHNRLGIKKQKPESSLPKPPQPTTSPRPQDDAGPSEPPETPAPETSAQMNIDPNLEQPEEDPSLHEPKDRIQILDLHTRNPLISYRNQLYSCEWTSTLGTDIILTAPTPDFPHPVLRQEPNVSVLAASTIKLIGRPAQIASRPSTEEAAQKSTPAPENSTPSTNAPSTQNPPPLKIPLGPTPTPARQNQATFLERLIAIKAKKGEKDTVTTHTQKVNQGSGWRSQRKASEALSDGEYEPAPKQSRRGNSTGTGGRPRGSRRKTGPRTAKGGLFRDYRPQLWDTPGADIRAGLSSTPDSWDRLDGGGASDERKTPVITTGDASPLPDVPAVNRSTGSLSPSASANATPTPPLPPMQATTNVEEISVAGDPPPSPSLASSSRLQPARVTEEDVGVSNVDMGDV